MDTLIIIVGIALIIGGSYMYIHRKKPTQKKYKTTKTSKRNTTPASRKEKPSKEVGNDVLRKPKQ